MEHLSNDHENHPIQHENSLKLCDEMEQRKERFRNLLSKEPYTLNINFAQSVWTVFRNPPYKVFFKTFK